MRGKDDVIDLLLVGLLGAGHVLVEDVPGVGKTTLAKALARALDVVILYVLNCETVPAASEQPEPAARAA